MMSSKPERVVTWVVEFCYNFCIKMSQINFFIFDQNRLRVLVVLPNFHNGVKCQTFHSEFIHWTGPGSMSFIGLLDYNGLRLSV